MTPRFSWLPVMALSVVALALAVPATAQVRLGLAGGFTPDPMEITITAAGDLAADTVVRGCQGFIAEDPALIIDFTGPQLPFGLGAGADSGLAGVVVIAPDGIARCAHVEAGGRATLRLDPAQSGEHAVWPALAEPGLAVAVRVFATELGQTSDGAAFDLHPTAEPASGRHVLATGGSVDFDLALDGTASASDFDADCTGQIDPARPDTVIGLDADQGQLQLRATSDTDTTLVVLDHNGRFHCNDDASGLDPAVTLRPAPAGDYAVWVGTYSGGTANARLSATAGVGPARAAPGETHVFTGARFETLLDLTPTAPAADFGPDCHGQINATGPDAVIRLDAERERVVFGASSDDDTTLVVLAPGTGASCNDDTHGLDPEVVLSPAPAGDYAVWIGTYGGSEATATLQVHAGDDASFAGGFSPMDESPFLGRPLTSAAEALAILLNEGELAGLLTYETIEPQDPEGFTLSGVVATDPTGVNPPLRIERLRIADLDLEGLTETGAPGRFRIDIEGIDYGTLIAALTEQGMIPPLPPLSGTPSLDLSASLLPVEGDAARRVVTSEITLAGAFALAIEARMRWHDGVGVPDDVADLPTESMAIELRNHGYLGELLRAQATAAGMQPAAMTRILLDALASMLAPVQPGSPAEQVVTALNAALADPDRSGVLRMSVATEDPKGLDALMEDFAGAAVLDNPALDIEVTFTPLE